MKRIDVMEKSNAEGKCLNRGAALVQKRALRPLRRASSRRELPHSLEDAPHNPRIDVICNVIIRKESRHKRVAPGQYELVA